MRLRRTVALGASVLHAGPPQRDGGRADPRHAAASPQPLPIDAARGEDGFTELGATLKMSLGARRFSALVEVYGRRTRYAVLYEDP